MSTMPNIKKPCETTCNNIIRAKVEPKVLASVWTHNIPSTERGRWDAFIAPVSFHECSAYTINRIWPCASKHKGMPPGNGGMYYNSYWGVGAVLASQAMV